MEKCKIVMNKSKETTGSCTLVINRNSTDQQGERGSGFMEIANRMKSYRAENGLTQTDLAQELGVSQASIALWERGATLTDAVADQLIEVGIICSEDLYDDAEELFSPEEVEFIAKNRHRLNVIGLAKALDTEYDKVLAMVSKIKEDELPMYDPTKGRIQVGELFYHKGYRTALVRELDGDMGVFFDQASATAFRAPLSFASKADGVRKRKVVRRSIMKIKVEGHLSTRRTSRLEMLEGTGITAGQLRVFEDGVSAGSEVLIKALAETFGVDTRTILHWARTEA